MPNPLTPTALASWAEAASKTAPGGDVSALNWQTPNGIEVKPLYTAVDLQGLQYTDTLPGFEPFLRGPQDTACSSSANVLSMPSEPCRRRSPRQQRTAGASRPTSGR